MITPDATPPEPIVPDVKDWTWVLDAPCDECGYSAAGVAALDVPARLRASLPRWSAALAGPDVAVRPALDVWSPLEYGCHVRDVFRLYDHRLQLMLSQDDPTYPNWDQDATAVSDAYGEQDPAAVAIALVAAGSTLADRFAGLTAAQWHRTGHRDDGKDFTVTSFARYFLHDVEHHLHDITGLTAVPG